MKANNANKLPWLAPLSCLLLGLAGLWLALLYDGVVEQLALAALLSQLLPLLYARLRGHAKKSPSTR